MKKKLIAILLIITIFLSFCFIAQADNGEKKYGHFSYKLKGNGNAVITGFDWDSNGDSDIYIPRSIDGYNVTEIGESAFADQTDSPIDDYYLETSRSISNPVVVVIPDTITVIGEKAFFSSRIASLTIPSSVQLIGAGAFADCYKILEFTVDSDNTTYATIDGVLYNKKTKELVAVPFAKYNDVAATFKIPNGIVSVGPYAFYKLKIEFPVVGTNEPCIIFPDSLTHICSYAFAETKFESQNNVLDLNNITILDSYAFANSTIDGKGFSWGKLESIGEYAFQKSVLWGIADNQVLSFPSSLTDIGIGAFQNSKMTACSILDLSQTEVTNIPDFAFDSAFFSGAKASNLILPSSLSSIGECAFRNMGVDEESGKINGTYIEFPDNLKSIGNYAFTNAGIYIQNWASSSKRLESIGNSAFEDACFFMDDETLVLPEGVKKIGDKAFFGEHLKAIQIPDSVTYIGSDLCNRSSTKIVANDGSYAALYASENGIPLEKDGGDDTSWLDD